MTRSAWSAHYVPLGTHTQEVKEPRKQTRNVTAEFQCGEMSDEARSTHYCPSSLRLDLRKHHNLQILRIITFLAAVWGGDSDPGV